MKKPGKFNKSQEGEKKIAKANKNVNLFSVALGIGSNVTLTKLKKW